MKFKFSFIFLISIMIALVYSDTVFHNPVIKDKNLPDPGVIYHGGFYYVINTATTPKSKFEIHKSTDLQNWHFVSFAFPEGHLPSWANPNSAFWAPEIHIINGKFRMYFTAREPHTDILCIGVASASTIEGPYKDKGSPLIRNTTVGSIDASVLTVGNGEYYLIWKDDGNGNVPKIPTWIWAQKLTDDGLNVVGAKTALIRNTLTWEADLVEAPWIIKRGDYYYLFYSGHSYCDDTYAVGVARSKNPLGPYEKKGNPILKTHYVWIGPGHCSVVRDVKDQNKFVMVYHAWHQGQVCGGNSRLLMVDHVQWSTDGWPHMRNRLYEFLPFF